MAETSALKKEIFFFFAACSN